MRRVLCLFYLLCLSSVVNAVTDSFLSWGTEPLDDGARCDVNAVRRANREQLHLLLEELTNTTFFRLFRVGLDGGCPITSASQDEDEEHTSCAVEGSDEGQCSLDVGREREKDLPPWMLNKQPVDRTISKKERTSLESDLSCEAPDFWFDMCHGLLTEDESKGWMNLQLNPERHTGYNGSKIWKVIYEQACFADNNNGFDATSEGKQNETESNKSYSCGHEERVLHRLISGLHASINTHVALFFYPPSASTLKEGSQMWRPNPARFMETVGSHPERIRNLNFAFVVLLRALRKAAPVFSSYSYAVSGDPTEDMRTAALVRRLLDSHLMSSCSQVFDSFDESLMFQNRTSVLKKAFKKSFLSISKTLDCIKCQKCRLHGKMQLTGIGLALKILLLPEDVLRTTPVSRLASREELVALFNTVHKFSHAIASVDYLTELYLTTAILKDVPPLTSAEKLLSSQKALNSGSASEVSVDKQASMQQSVESIARAYFAGSLSDSEEDALLRLATGVAPETEHDRTVLNALARGYGSVDAGRFAMLAKRFTLSGQPSSVNLVVVVGSGLAGSTTALSLLDSTTVAEITKVVLMDKQTFLGGNSVYASSGMNAVDEQSRALGDSVESFAQDMAKSGGKAVEDHMIQALTRDSEDALKWVRTRTGQAFEEIGQLGGHSHARTHRPRHGQAGAELVFAMHKLLKTYSDAGRLEILKGERLVGMERVGEGWKVKTASGKVLEDAAVVVLATGGFTANKQLLPSNVRGFGTTNGPFTTGDAVPLLSSLGATMVDMDKVQLHPTAFASDDKTQQQPLCAEILRGVGGVLVNSKCARFADELGTRAYLSQRMIEEGEKDYVLILSEEQASEANHFRELYTKRGLMVEVTSLDQVAQFAKCSLSSLTSTLSKYVSSAARNRDEFNKTAFANADTLLTSTRYYVGRVQPAVHYCMGGVSTDAWARVLTDGHALKGVYAVGEVSGGLHGNNRLGGNGMTEALVFGRRAAAAIARDMLERNDSPNVNPIINGTTLKPNGELLEVTISELNKHNSMTDCWVAIRGKVYDFSSFVREHPGGVEVIMNVAGKDGTDLYEEVHTPSFLQDFAPVGRLVTSPK